MKVIIEFDLRPLDPIGDEDAPSDPLDNRDEVEGKVEQALGLLAMEKVEEVLFDSYGWTFDSHTIKVIE